MSVDPSPTASKYEDLLAEAAAIVGGGGLRPPSYGSHASGRERWEVWSRRAGIEPWPPQPALVAAWVTERFGLDPVSTIEADLAALRRHAWTTAAADPTRAGKRVLTNLVRSRGVLPARKARGSVPVLSIEQLGAMADIDCPLDLRLRHAELVLVLGLRWPSAWFRHLKPDQVQVDMGNRTVLVTDREGGRWVLKAHPDPFHCPVRAVVLLLAHRRDRLIPGPPSKLAPNDGARGNLRARKPSDVLWTPERITAAIDVVAEPLRMAARNQALVAVGYHTAWRPVELRTVPIAGPRRTPDGWLVPAPAEAGRAGRTILLEPCGGALDPVIALDAWFEAWPRRGGALFPGRLRPMSIGEEDPKGICAVSLASVLASMAEAGGVTKPAAGSLRRSRGAHVWQATGDLRALGRVMGYSDLLSAWRFARRLDPGAAAEMVGDRRASQ